MKRLLYLFILLLFSCSANKELGRIVEQSGDTTLKTHRSVQKNYYIGHSQSSLDLDEAFRNAIIQAHSMIAGELGINIRISSSEITSILGMAHVEDLSYHIQREINLESEHNIQTRINRVYQESVMLQNTLFYRAWVELFFDIDAFYRRYQDFWSTEVRNLQSIDLQRINSRFITNLERVHDLGERFEEEKRYLSNNLVRDFENLQRQYLSSFNTNKQKINVHNIANNNKFSNDFVFEIRFDNEYLSNFPVRINNTDYLTNHSGQINYTADFERPIVIVIGHNLQGHYATRDIAVYFNDSFSPYQNRNVSLSVNSGNDTIKNSYIKIFENRGFKIGENPDIVVDITPIGNTENTGINQFLTEVRFRVVLSAQIGNLRSQSIVIPYDRAETIRGHGRTEIESITNAFNMEWYGRVDEEFDRIEQIIRELIISNY